MARPAAPPVAAPPRNRVEAALETWLFRSRWLLAPFYIGLVLGLVGLLVVFVREVVHEAAGLLTMKPEDAILMALSLIDLSLAGNLLLIVIFSGYETFVSKIHTGDDVDRPGWMGAVDFSGLKLKLIASIVAISAIALLRAYMRLIEGPGGPDDRTLAWLVGINLTFVVSGVLLALMDLLTARAKAG